MINPTGSTGYGQEFTDRIQNEWGGRPYLDLEKCWEHIRDNLSYVDTENGVALGASYGGYMISKSFSVLSPFDKQSRVGSWE
jgi:dipeptidyl aminopeptidase/acylaminoacyl peptidase